MTSQKRKRPNCETLPGLGGSNKHRRKYNAGFAPQVALIPAILRKLEDCPCTRVKQLVVVERLIH